MSFDTRAFRQALGSFPTGVAVITALSPSGAPMGITVNSFTSVSLEPPMVLWCLDKKSDRYAVFAKANGFTISAAAASGTSYDLHTAAIFWTRATISGGAVS